MRTWALAVALALLLVAGCGGEDEPRALTGGSQATSTDAATSTAIAIGGEEGAAIAAVLARIASGDPSPYSEDGSTFQNREGLLPEEPLGYYREYTVETPGSPDRGARRLVIGSGGETYYTDDHYASFERIDPEDYQ